MSCPVWALVLLLLLLVLPACTANDDDDSSRFNKWQALSTSAVLPSERVSSVMRSMGGRLAVYGGSSNASSDGSFDPAIWFFDPVQQVWESVAPAVRPAPRALHVGSALGTGDSASLLVAAGSGPAPGGPSPTSCLQMMPDAWLYRPASQSWFLVVTSALLMRNAALSVAVDATRVAVYGGIAYTGQVCDPWLRDAMPTARFLDTVGPNFF